jgi:hypothetical protein
MNQKYLNDMTIALYSKQLAWDACDKYDQEAYRILASNELSKRIENGFPETVAGEAVRLCWEELTDNERKKFTSAGQKMFNKLNSDKFI